MKKQFLFYLSLLLFNLPIYAQIRVSGNITDSKTNEPLVGVNVVLKGDRSVGNISDLDGNFTIEVPNKSSVLTFSYIGYVSQDIEVGAKTTINVRLVEDTQNLDEVVVVGYGTMKKRDLTGSVSQIKADKMTEFTVPNPIQALQGRVPGVVITQNSGSPEGSFSIRIRGTNSIRGDNSPLYIIDGVPANASSINNYDIESVEVLKDASATAIYGSRGANGVILITTKRGKSGGTQVDYNFEYGIQSQIKKLKYMDAKEYMEFYNEQRVVASGKEYFTADQIASAGKGTDWQDAIFQDAPIQNHSISIRGGNEKTKITVSASAMMRDGLIKNSSYDKYIIRSSIDHAINNWFDVSLISSYARTGTSRQSSSGNNRGGSLIGAAYSTPPTVTAYNEDGTYREMKTIYPFISNAIVNAEAIINETRNKTTADLANTNASLTWKPFKGFSIKSSFGMQSLNYRGDSYTNSVPELSWTSGASVSQNQQTDIINENIANYNNTFGDHSINAMGGFTYQQYIGKSMGMSGSGFLSDAPETYQIGAASTFGTPSTSYTKWVLMSYLGRINYSYKGKYMATVSIRADGSSRYSEGDKWGYFPSGALAWRISGEDFMSGYTNISDLKLRLGWGQTGSTAISPYTTLNMLSQGKTALNSDLYTYYAPSSTYPAPLKWETTTQTNIGFDLAMFKSRLRFTADFYYKKTTDLLNAVSLPSSTGYSSTIQNIGEMSNRGIELQLDGDIISTKDITWSASANIAFNKNKVDKLYGGNDIYGSSVGLAYIDGYINLIREGEPLGVFNVFKKDGYDENGVLKYVDINNDGNLTNEDRFILGDPNPDFTYGLNSSLRYKNLEFSMFWQGSQGNDIYNVGETANYDYGMGLNLKRDVYLSHWKETNTAEQNAAAKYPKISANQNLVQSDRFIEDGSYLRLKNIMFAYNLPISAMKIDKYISKLQLYISAQNILTITNYSGVDPEVNSWGGGNSINLGLDYLSYPNNKTISFGAKLSF